MPVGCSVFVLYQGTTLVGRKGLKENRASEGAMAHPARNACSMTILGGAWFSSPRVPVWLTLPAKKKAQRLLKVSA
jgi:hypothetical protein